MANLECFINMRPTPIRHQMTLDDPALLLPCQLMKDRSECLANVPKELLTTSFGYEHHVILAIPAGMRQALRGLRHGVRLVWAHQATRGELYSWNAQSCASRTGRTSGLPQIES